MYTKTKTKKKGSREGTQEMKKKYEIHSQTFVGWINRLEYFLNLILHGISLWPVHTKNTHRKVPVHHYAAFTHIGWTSKSKLPLGSVLCIRCRFGVNGPLNKTHTFSQSYFGATGFQSQSVLPYLHCRGEHNVASLRSTSGAIYIVANSWRSAL